MKVVSQQMIDDFFDLMRHFNRIDLNMNDHLLMSETYVLHCLVKHQGDTLLTVSDLATQLNLSLASISRTLRQLDEQGLIQRFKDENDRRTSRIQITQAGKEAYQRAIRSGNQSLKQWLSQFDQEDLNDFISTGKLIVSTWNPDQLSSK